MRPRIKAALATLAVTSSLVTIPATAYVANAETVSSGREPVASLEDPAAFEYVNITGALPTAFARNIKVQEFIANRWTVIGSFKTLADGSYNVRVKAPVYEGVNKKIRIIALGYKAADGTEHPAYVSRTVAVRAVGSAVSASAPSVVEKGAAAVVSIEATLSRAKRGVSLQSLSSTGTWGAIASGSLIGSSGTINIPTLRDGSKLYRIRLAGSNGAKPVFSNAFTVHVGTPTASAEDFDMDGVLDADEAPVFLDANNPDTDLDGVIDGLEVNTLGSDALNVDSDFDGVRDGLESLLRLSLIKVDTDGDTISDLDELRRGINARAKNADSDSDGVTDVEENRFKLKVADVDTDDDTLGDGEELFLYGTDPRSADSDCDGVTDGEEIAAGTDPVDGCEASDTDIPGAVEIDTDGDGVADTTEGRVGSDPTDVDSDDDGLWDGAELDLGTDPVDTDSDSDGLGDGGEVTVGADPTNPDTDGDGLGDGGEVDAGANPTNPDTDGDTVADGGEVSIGTDPTDADTDSDGLGDGPEAPAGGTDPLDGDTDSDGLGDGTEVTTDPTNPDTDADGSTDGTEVGTGTDPINTDTDGDGVNDGGEVDGGTNPTNPDSDGDGDLDGDEVDNGTNPTNPGSNDGVNEGLKFKSVSRGQKHACGITTAGALFCWGDNGEGQLGIGDYKNDADYDKRSTKGREYGRNGQSDRSKYKGRKADFVSPMRVGTASDWVSVDAGKDHTCAINAAGALFCWGDNSKGQVGNAGKADVFEPVRVGGNTTYTAVAAGTHTTCAVTTSSQLACWGQGTKAKGLLKTDAVRPTLVGGNTPWNRVYADGEIVVAVDVNGHASVWK